MRAAGSSLALSVSLRSPALPKGEPLAWRYSFRLKPSPAGGRWCVAPDEGQTVCDFLQRHAFAESGATTAVFRHDPTCEKGVQESPRLRSNKSPSEAFKRQSGLRKQMEGLCPDKLRRRFCTPKYKIIFPLNMPRANAEGI